jgi:hypothetical protein
MVRHFLSFLAVLSLAACASGPPKRAVEISPASIPPSNAAELAAAEQQVLNLITLKYTRCSEELAGLQAAIGAPTFSMISIDLQYEALDLAAKIAICDHQPQIAYEYLLRVVAMPRAVFEDQADLLYMAVRLRHSNAAAILISLTQRWPEQIAKVNSSTVIWLLNDERAVFSTARDRNGGLL